VGVILGPGIAGIDRFIAAPPGAAWDLLVDVTAWPLWGPSVRRAILHDGATGLSLGTRGDVWTAVGVRLPFVITEFEPGHRWTWKVSGVRATGHQVTAAPGGCRVRFEVPRWATAYLPVCAVALSRIESALERCDIGDFGLQEYVVEGDGSQVSRADDINKRGKDMGDR